MQLWHLMEKGMGLFGLMMCCVEAARRLSPSVFTVAGESTIAVTMKMLL